MSTETRWARARGNSMREAWDNLVGEDTYERGHGIYNGRFGDCNFPKEVKEFPKYIDKRESFGICRVKPVLNNNKIKSQVENFPQKGKREWKTEYYAVKIFGDEIGIKSPSQTECIKKTREYIEKNGGRADIYIRKVLNVSPRVASVEYKGAANEKMGEWEFMAGTPS